MSQASTIQAQLERARKGRDDRQDASVGQGRGKSERSGRHGPHRGLFRSDVQGQPAAGPGRHAAGHPDAARRGDERPFPEIQRACDRVRLRATRSTYRTQRRPLKPAPRTRRGGAPHTFRGIWGRLRGAGVGFLIMTAFNGAVRLQSTFRRPAESPPLIQEDRARC